MKKTLKNLKQVLEENLHYHAILPGNVKTEITFDADRMPTIMEEMTKNFGKKIEVNKHYLIDEDGYQYHPSWFKSSIS